MQKRSAARPVLPVLFAMIALLGVQAGAGCKSTDGRDGSAAAGADALGGGAGPVGVAPEQAEVNGFEVAGYEYWPYRELQPLFPDRIRRGFAAGSEAAQACMQAARVALVAMLREPPAELLELREKHGVARFTLWNNDYTGADDDGMAPPRFRAPWLFQRATVKWISETKRDGGCVVPAADELRRLAKRCLARFPDC